jgi:hypothetical protein
MRDPPAADGIVAHLDEQMEVIRHQTVGVEIEGELRLLVREDVNEPEIVIV